ncbi:MAG: hypothetical protein ABII01_01930 [Candidatus Woesearchaeota archaeon]
MKIIQNLKEYFVLITFTLMISTLMLGSINIGITGMSTVAGIATDSTSDETQADILGSIPDITIVEGDTHNFYLFDHISDTVLSNAGVVFSLVGVTNDNRCGVSVSISGYVSIDPNDGFYGDCDAKARVDTVQDIYDEESFNINVVQRQGNEGDDSTTPPTTTLTTTTTTLKITTTTISTTPTTNPNNPTTSTTSTTSTTILSNVLSTSTTSSTTSTTILTNTPTTHPDTPITTNPDTNIPNSNTNMPDSVSKIPRTSGISAAESLEIRQDIERANENIITMDLSEQGYDERVIDIQTVDYSWIKKIKVLDELSDDLAYYEGIINPEEDENKQKIRHQEIEDYTKKGYNQAKKSVKVDKDVGVIEKDNISIVSITLNPIKGPVYNISIYELIPKNIAESSSDLIFLSTGNSEVKIIKDDPLIVWHVSVLEDETKLRYGIRDTEKDILDETKTVAVMDPVEDEKSTLKIMLTAIMSIAIISMVLFIKIIHKSVSG